MLDDPNYIVGAGADNHVSLGALLEFIVVIANIGTAVVLFPIVKRQHEIFALGYVTSRVLEGAIIMVGVFSLLTVVSLRSGFDPATPLQDLAGTAGADAAHYPSDTPAFCDLKLNLQEPRLRNCPQSF